MRNLGVDLHSDSFVVCYMEQSGKCIYKQYPLKKLTAFKKSLRATDRMAVEATGNTRFFYDSVAALVEKFVVVNPGQFEVIKKSTNKTDKNDAKSLALFLSKDLLPGSADER